MGVITERERQKYFAYLDGVADGLNESRNDVNSVLYDIKQEIEQRIPNVEYDIGNGLAIAISIIDKYRAESEEQE